MLEIFTTAEVLPVGILQKTIDHSFVTDVVSMLEVVEANQQPNRQTGATEVLDVQGAEFSVKERPVERVRQTKQGMLAVKDLIQSGAKQFALI